MGLHSLTLIFFPVRLCDPSPPGQKAPSYSTFQREGCRWTGIHAGSDLDISRHNLPHHASAADHLLLLCFHFAGSFPLCAPVPLAGLRRYACPNGCSGNGACRSMREMGLTSAAEPLVAADVAYGWESPEGAATWDSRSMFGCVCDSSWEVSARTRSAGFKGASHSS